MAEGAGSFITRSFERMLKDSSEKKFLNLHKALKAYLERSKSVENLSPPSPESSNGSFGQGDATSTGRYGLDEELVLLPLRLAFETRQHKLVESALDCLHKLISYGNIEGDAGLEDGDNSASVTELFTLVCDVAHTSVLDSTILQVMKVLLTAVASTKFRVHGDCLIRSINECIHIVISSKSQINQATAKAALTQMVSIIFKRMDDESQEQYSYDEGMVTVAEAFVSERLKDVERNALPFVAVSMEELQRLVTDADMKGLEAALVKGGPSDGGIKMPGGPNLEGMPRAQQDALIVFHMLCQTLMKEESKEALKKERVLCLELLQGIMEDASKTLIMNLGFMNTIKEYLCYVLLRAGMSSTPAIFQLSCDVFRTLLLRFRGALKAEIGVLFFLIVLRSLDRLDSPVLHRLSVLRLLETICNDPQIVADIFVNYDCDPEAISLFERMVRALSKIAQGKIDGDLSSSDVSQLSFLKVSSLQCLVSALKSLLLWTRLFKETTEALTVDPTSIESASSSTAKHNTNLEGRHYPHRAGDVDIHGADFEGMSFDVAIRLFLKDFQFPSDMQQFDRIAEEFAQGYCLQNPGYFESADVAYVLIYAVIMLNSSVHDPMVWPKMTKEEFVHSSFLRKQDISMQTELLEGIYQSITDNQIELHYDSTLPRDIRCPKATTQLIEKLNIAVPRRTVSAITKMEGEAFAKKTQALFKEGVMERHMFYAARHVELVWPLLDVLGWPLLVALSVMMEEGTDTSQVLLCMEGFKIGIHLTKFLGMDTMRYAFLSSVVRFTLLHTPKGMRSKSIEALRTLLALSDAEPDAMKDTWNAILECISRLEYITSSPSILVSLMVGSDQVSKDTFVISLKDLAKEPTEQIFVNTMKLSGDAVIEFFTALCGVSTEELKQVPPRVFSLEKLVEISYYNISRIRIVWLRIWGVLSEHFILAGSHPNEKVAIYAIHSLRQLVIKNLEHSELLCFSFQIDILRPFVVLMSNKTSLAVRSLVLDCIVQMVKSHAKSIRSGWRSMFMVFNKAASDDMESINEIAFETVEQIILEHFGEVAGDCFMDCVLCLFAFANNVKYARISLKSIALLRICEDRLAEGLIPGGDFKRIQLSSEELHDKVERYWYPMLSGLATLTADSRIEVRNCALEVLFDLLKERGDKFSESFWKRVFEDVLFPILDHIRNAELEVASAGVWLRESCILALRLLCNLFSTFYKEVSFVLPSLLGFLLDCATSSDLELASMSIEALAHLIEVGGDKFSKQDWETILKRLRDACSRSQPLELLDSPTGSSGSLSPFEPFLGHNDDDKHNLAGDTPSPAEPEVSCKSEEKGVSTKSQTLGQALMDTILLRNLTHKGKENHVPTVVTESTEDCDFDEPTREDLYVSTNIRNKCLRQIWFLGVLDRLQSKHWTCLYPGHKMLIVDVLASIVEFAASYNSYTNIEKRVRQFGNDRPPINMLRQEVEGTRIYLSVLNQALREPQPLFHEEITNNSHSSFINGLDAVYNKMADEFQEAMEEKLVSFCEKTLKEASNQLPGMGEAIKTDAFMALTLRVPVVVMVMDEMCKMQPQMFQRHLADFYPYFMQLICSEQLEVRRGLDDLFKAQLVSALP